MVNDSMPGLQPVTSYRGVDSPSYRCMMGGVLSDTLRGRDLAEEKKNACICNASVPPPPQTEAKNLCAVHRSSSRRFPHCQLGQSAAFLPSPHLHLHHPPAQRTASACRALLSPSCLPLFVNCTCSCVSLCKIPPCSSLWCVYMCQGLLLRRYKKRHRRFQTFWVIVVSKASICLFYAENI